MGDREKASRGHMNRNPYKCQEHMKLNDWRSTNSLIPFSQQIGTPFDWIILRKWVPRSSGEQYETGVCDVRIRVASSAEELAVANQLVTTRYGWRGYEIASQDGASPAPAEKPRGCFTLLVYREEAIVGTLTVGIDNGPGLLADDLNPETVETLRRAGRRAVEFIKLAVQDDQDANGVLYHLFRAAYERARMLHEATDILIEVNPRHTAFYQKVFGFALAAAERLCPRVNAPAVLLHLDLAKLDQQHSLRLKLQAVQTASKSDFALAPVALAA